MNVRDAIKILHKLPPDTRVTALSVDYAAGAANYIIPDNPVSKANFEREATKGLDAIKSWLAPPHIRGFIE